MKIKIDKNLWSLEWSFNQRCFHVERLSDCIKSNLSCLISDGHTDYVLIGIFKSDLEASAAAGIIRKKKPELFL